MHITKHKDLNRELIIDATLNLIDEKAGLTDVNLRGIAKTIGCAHTNIYNYFESFDNLIWHSLGEAMKRMLDSCGKNIPDGSDGKSIFIIIMSDYIDFSLLHTGWFRLIWTEKLNGEMPEEILKVTQTPGISSIEMIKNISSGKISGEEAQRYGNIINSYILGELSNIINKRQDINDNEAIKKRIIDNVKLLLDKLIK